MKEINDLFMHGKFVLSFDVESLFTKIPLEECINLAVKYITESNPGLKVKFAAKENHFLFKVSFYHQGDGVALGSPLAPVLPNHFMESP